MDGVLFTNDPDLYKSGPTSKTFTTILTGKHPHEKILPAPTLEKKRQNIYSHSNQYHGGCGELVTQKLSSSLGPGGM